MNNETKVEKSTFLTFIGDAEGPTKNPMAVYKCVCGNEKVIRKNNVQKLKTISCGCKKLERSITHGLSWSTDEQTHKIYRLWSGIKNRCNNSKEKCYHRYGGRGIKMCNEWANNFEVFFNWCKSNGFSIGLKIDRKNNDLGYFPGNCRFVTNKVNCNNKSHTIFIECDGQKKTISEWSEVLNIGVPTIRYRYDHNWSPENILKKEIRPIKGVHY